MNVYVIRHGKTLSNAQGIFNGRSNEDISETGIQQAKAAGEIIRNIDLDLVVCSPMLRTRHTAELVNVNRVPVIYDERLIERDTGDLTGHLIESIPRHEYWNYNFEGYNAESPKALCDRVWSLLDELKEKYSDKNILIVTHNGVTRSICAYFKGLPEDMDMLNYGTHDNCQIREYLNV